MVRLNKIQCFLFGLGVILLFYILNRVNHIIGSEKVNGTMVFYIEEDGQEGKLFYPIIEYEYNDSIFRFRAREGASYELKQNIPVLLEEKDPDKPLVFTIGSFWLYPMFYIIFPIALWAAFSLSYVNKNEFVEINLRYPFIIKRKNNNTSVSKKE